MFIWCNKKRNGYYRGTDCIKKLKEILRGRTTIIINYEEQEMIPRTYEETKSYEKQKECHVCKKGFCYDENKKNNFTKKSEIIVITQENLEELLIVFAI